jgi:hypothetical protein
MDEDTLLDFLFGLPEEDQRSILTGLTDAKETPIWKKVLENTDSPWHMFYMEALNQFAPDRYLDNLRLTIPQRWQNGLPIIADLLAHNNYQGSLDILQETLSALLSRHRAQGWTPETSLLVTVVGGFYSDEASFDTYQTLLEYFQQTARGLGQTERANTLQIQRVALEHCFDWQKMFQAFADLPLEPATRQALFQSWRSHVIKRATPENGAFGSRPTADTGWLHWLIDSIAEPQKGAPWFQQQIRQWLAHLPRDRQALGAADYDRLQLLTNDLNAIQASQPVAYPIFNQVVLWPSQFSAPDNASRQAYLRQFAPDDLWEQVMGYWKTYLSNFVPDPKSAAKSDYTQHAKWMAALKELNPTAYATLLAQWVNEHNRRTNLWKALDNLGLG